MDSSAESKWPFTVRPLAPKLGAEISDFALADDMSDDVFRAIYRAFLRYQVLLFPSQDVPPGRQIAFARRFGPVQIHVMNRYHADGHPELYRLSNLDKTPPVDHPVVRTHPETGRTCLYLGDHAEYIVGMPYAEGRADRGIECDGAARRPDVRAPLETS